MKSIKYARRANADLEDIIDLLYHPDNIFKESDSKTYEKFVDKLHNSIKHLP